MANGKGGRPSKYKPEFAKQAKQLCDLGATDEELAKFFEVHLATIYRWRNEFPEFCDALKVGKAAADDRVEKSLYQKAVGYTFDSEKIMAIGGEVKRVQIKEHVPPSDTACIFWLKNRRGDDWRDKVEHGGKNGGPIEFVMNLGDGLKDTG